MLRRLIIFFVLVLIVVGGYTLSRIVWSSAEVPGEFRTARLQGALIAQDIVNLSNRVSSDVEKVSELEKEKKNSEALNIAHDLVTKSGEVRTKAVALANELSKMTTALASVSSVDARGAALESISDRLALISRLITYSDYLSQLVNAIQERISGGRAKPDVPALVQQINAEVTSINNFNRLAGEAMERFDKIVEKQ